MRRGALPVLPLAPVSNVVPTTSGLPFPASAEEALVQITKHVRLTGHSNRNRAGNRNAELQPLIDNDIFYISADKRSSRLNASQQFSLLRIFARFFNEKSDDHDPNKYAYFEVLFLGREGDSFLHKFRIDVLFNLASFALQFPVLSIYVQICQWLSKVSNGNFYAEELVKLLVDHYIRTTSPNMYEFLLPLEVSCPEFSVHFLRFSPCHIKMNKGLANVLGSYIHINIGYILNWFRDAPKASEIFAKQSFPPMVRFVLTEKGDEGMSSLFSGIYMLLEKWTSKVKGYPLDCEVLFDESLPWEDHRITLILFELDRDRDYVKQKMLTMKIPSEYELIMEEVMRTNDNRKPEATPVIIPT